MNNLQHLVNVQCHNVTTNSNTSGNGQILTKALSNQKCFCMVDNSVLDGGWDDTLPVRQPNSDELEPMIRVVKFKQFDTTVNQCFSKV